MSLSRYDEEIERLKNRARSVKERAEETAKDFQSAAVMGGAAYLFGYMEAKAAAENRALATVGGAPATLSWGIGAYVGSKIVGGKAGEVMADAGKSIISIHMYKTGSAAGAARR
jgi:hypothetical protein